MPLRQKDLPLTIPALTEAHVLAIGHIITQWAYFEGGIDEELRQLGADGETLKLSTKKRLKAWRDLSLIAYSANSDHVRLVRQIYGDATRLKPLRDEASHGRWAISGRSISLIRQHFGEIVGIKDKSRPVREMERGARQMSQMNAVHFALQNATINIREPPR